MQRIHEALTLAQEMAHLSSLAYALDWAAMLHRFRREVEAAQERAAAAITLSTEQGFAVYLAWGTIVQGWSLAEQGQGAEGTAQIRQGLATSQAMGLQAVLPYHLALLAEAYGKAGQGAEGLRVLAEALTMVNNTGERNYEAELYRLKGELLLQQGMEGDEEAETCFRQALDIARQQQAKSLELRAAMSLSRLWQQQGKRAAARQLLAETYGWFTEGFE